MGHLAQLVAVLGTAVGLVVAALLIVRAFAGRTVRRLIERLYEQSQTNGSNMP